MATYSSPTSTPTTYTRANAWNDGGTFDNPDLLWYAKGVRAMQARELSDSSSWWFFAAIHGEALDLSAFPGWGFLPSPPGVPTAPLPSQAVQDEFWNQCQHQSWYFAPWHRGYLLALEAQIRAAVIDLGGPATWALPYWNYFGPNGEYQIPPAFTAANLPDGTSNPLFVEARYGPKFNGDIYVPIPPVSQKCLTNTIYTGTNPDTPIPGFGGPQTGFWHGGGTSGNLEGNPHNPVHGYVGGNSPDGETWGLMSDVDLAGLDPIFYLHHANIDRLWAVWNVGNANPTDPQWLDGPAVGGNQEFVMPMPDGSSWVFTPGQVDSLDKLNYTYDNLAQPAPAAAPSARRLARLGAAEAAAAIRRGATVSTPKNQELVGASSGSVPIVGSEARTTVRLDSGVQRKMARSLSAASESAAPDRVFLNLENVRGARDSFVLNVYLNLPDGANPREFPEHLAGSVGLFGLRRASLADGRHAGEGLSFILEITDIIDRLHLDGALDANALDVKIVPHNPVPEQAQITVGRISIYRLGEEE